MMIQRYRYILERKSHCSIPSNSHFDITVLKTARFEIKTEIFFGFQKNTKGNFDRFSKTEFFGRNILSNFFEAKFLLIVILPW